MRCVVAMMQHETNTFSTLPTTLRSFAIHGAGEVPPSGQDAIDIYGATDFAFAAMLAAAADRHAEISVPIAAYAEPSGKADSNAFEIICERICADVARGCDAVLLDLHGAMVTAEFDDGEGELLKRIRAVAPNVPIAVALDFHANISATMVANCNVLDGYRTYPHIDMYETGERAAKTLFDAIEQDHELHMQWRSVPMMSHMILQTPARQPMKDIMDLAIAAAGRKGVTNASVFGSFPLADIQHVGLSAVVCARTDTGEGQELVDSICYMAWQRRADFVFTSPALEFSIAQAKSLDDYPVVIADHGDNCGAGGSADDMTVLAEILAQGLKNILVAPLWDPDAVTTLIEAGQGAEVDIEIGGNTDVPSIAQQGKSIRVHGTVKAITDGLFEITGPMQTGLKVELGRTVVFGNDDVDIVISEQRWEAYDPGCFTHAGLEPADYRYVLLKSRQHFRAGFESMAKHIVLAAGPGVCSSNYSQFPFKNLRRPIYPIDIDTPAPDFLGSLCKSPLKL